MKCCVNVVQNLFMYCVDCNNLLCVHVFYYNADGDYEYHTDNAAANKVVRVAKFKTHKISNINLSYH